MDEIRVVAEYGIHEASYLRHSFLEALGHVR